LCSHLPLQVSAQQDSLTLTSDEKTWIKNQDTVYFGYDPDWKPYEFINNKGLHDGIMEELLQLVRERSGLNFQPYPNLTWESSLKALSTNKVQFLPCIGVTEDRVKIMSFTSEYMSFPFVIINRKDDQFVGEMKDLKELTLAMPIGYLITEKVERNYPEIKIVYTNSFEEALLLIITNKADATLEGLPVASYYLNYRGFDNLQIAANANKYDMNLHMSVKLGNDTLLSVLEKYINSITPSEKQNIINKWVTVQYQHGVNMKRVWRVTALYTLVILIILGVIIIWNRTLKKQIIRRKQAEKQLVATNKELRLQKELLEQRNKEITDSIIYAKHIQNAILPPNDLIKQHLPHSFILYKPKDIVAGDFYWMESKGDSVFIAVADCTGHGVPGALVSVTCNNSLNRSIREFGLTNPGEILDKTRDILLQEFAKSEEEINDGMDIAMCQLEGNTLHYAGANNPLWIIRNGEVIEIKADKQPIGKHVSNIPFTTHILELEKGDSFYIFSDGYSDQFGGEKGKKYKTVNFRKFLLSIQKYTMDEQHERLNLEFENWKETLEQIDDVCIIGVKI